MFSGPRPSIMAALALCKIQISFVVFCANLWITTVTGSYRCPSECTCLQNMVDCYQRGLVTVPRDLPIWMESLDLTSNNIEEISPDTFKNLSNLRELVLSTNKIRQLDVNIFSALPSLKKLTLSYNEVEEMPKFPTNYNLTDLDLSHNKVKVIDAAMFQNIPHIQKLDLGFNKITTLHNQTFPFLPNLEELYLNNNKIGQLGMGTFHQLPNLASLKLGKNQIPSLQKNIFVKLGKLKHLDLNRNRLTEIVGLTFTGLKKLVTLKLKRNNISELQAGAFSNWGPSEIQTLELDNNSLTEIKKEGLIGLNSLKRLSITNNVINRIESGSWECCPHITILNLSNNSLERVESGAFSKLSSLNELSLSNNRVSYITLGAFNDLASLNKLEMNNNEISWNSEDQHGPFEGLDSLTQLHLESNRIKAITKTAFEGLGRLKHLHLGHNQISTLENKAFAGLEELQGLYMNTSSLLCDCELAWFPNWLRDSDFQDTVSAKCSLPESVSGQSVLQVDKFKCDEFPKPVIDTPPVSQIALKGSNFTLQCGAWSSSTSPMTIEWWKDNTPITVAKINTTATMIEGGIKMTSTMTIASAQDQHAGAYQCVAENDIGPTYSKKADIKVNVFPVFTKVPKDFTVRIDTSVELECAAAGQPVPEISWQKDGGDDFPSARERRMHFNPETDTYFITNLKTEDMGVYSCMASNEAGTIVTNVTLTVLEVPSFSKPMQDDRVEEGKTAVLPCMAKGSPQPRLEWQKDGQPLELTLTSRHFFTTDDQLLIIVNARTEDSGKYTCKMINTLGSVSDSMWLTVTGGGGSATSLFKDSTTTGIIIIAVVCCVVGTSLIWVVIIYQTRRKSEEYSSTPTEETVVPEVAYNSSDPNGHTRTIYTAQGPYSKVYVNGGPVKNGGLHASNGGFNITRNPLEHTGSSGELVGQDSREPLVSSSSSGSGSYTHHNPQYALPPHHHPYQHYDHQSLQRDPHSGSSISVASSSCSSTDGGSSDSHSSPPVVLSTFHPYPLGRLEDGQSSVPDDPGGGRLAGTSQADGCSLQVHAFPPHPVYTSSSSLCSKPHLQQSHQSFSEESVTCSDPSHQPNTTALPQPPPRTHSNHNNASSLPQSPSHPSNPYTHQAHVNKDFTRPPSPISQRRSEAAHHRGRNNNNNSPPDTPGDRDGNSNSPGESRPSENDERDTSGLLSPSATEETVNNNKRTEECVSGGRRKLFTGSTSQSEITPETESLVYSNNNAVTA